MTSPTHPPIPSFEDFQRQRPGVWPPPIRWRRWSPRREWDENAVASVLPAWREDRCKLHEKCVVVMGLGAVGGVCFEQLAKLGVGRLYGLDPDLYGEDSWITQPSLVEQCGRRKADVQGCRAARANPWAEVATAAAFAQDVPLAVLRQADVIVLAGDNLELLVWAGEYAVGLGKVVVQGAVYGAAQQAIVRGFNLADPATVCPTCLLAESDWGHMTSRLGCDPAIMRRQGIEPTQTLPHVCATAGQMTASEVIKWLLGKSDSALSGAEVQYNLIGHRALRTAFTRKAACRGPHRRWRVIDLPQSWRATTLAELASEVDLPPEPEDATRGASRRDWQVKAEVPWIARASCWSCGKVHPVRRFSRLGRSVGRCPCGGVLWADLEGRRSLIPVDDLKAAWNKPLSRLGLRGGESFAFCHDEDVTWLVLS